MKTPPDIHWTVPSQLPTLGFEDVHLWCVWLDDPAIDHGAIEGVLSPDELVRARGLYHEEDRRRFAAARLTLRRVLAAYLGGDPAGITFRYGQYNKPSLALSLGEGGLQFNLSHSHALCLLAVTRGRPVGVDVEEVRDLPDLYLIEDRLFAPDELGAQQARPAEERRLEFFRRWTQREAIGKGRGSGLDSLAPMRTDGGADSFALQPLEPAEGYVGTLAFAGGPARVGLFRWQENLSYAALSPGATAA
ncbi:MAG TPA: 4'-phosphopantetheinyl transferase superfamily protein [Opitutaceae bacterium]|nr:4'-phosphopantetheinyl transferase superfamily protein [Opitutaceae bacterium]